MRILYGFNKKIVIKQNKSYMNRNICFTLAFNTPDEVEVATKLLYEQNGDVEHIIIDLSFPLEKPDEIPANITHARIRNSERLRNMAKYYNSTYVKLDNIGVSQNWTQAYELIAPDDSDLLIGVDPDERPQTPGWVKAMGIAYRDGGYNLVSLGQAEQAQAMKNPEWREHYGVKWIDKEFSGVKMQEIHGGLNMALIGLSGKFFNQTKQLSYPTNAPRYGWIEGAIMPTVNLMGGWCVLPEYEVIHTLSSPLYGEWKLFITSRQDLWPVWGQPEFGTWLRWKRAGILP